MAPDENTRISDGNMSMADVSFLFHKCITFDITIDCEFSIFTVQHIR